jgi:hypothetical protein
MLPANKPDLNKRWSLWRAALYGLLLQAFANGMSAVADKGKDAALWWNASDAEMIVHFTAMMVPAPALFVLVAWLHNRRLKKTT